MKFSSNFIYIVIIFIVIIALSFSNDMAIKDTICFCGLGRS